jgi:hypothetical protein
MHTCVVQSLAGGHGSAACLFSLAQARRFAAYQEPSRCREGWRTQGLRGQAPPAQGGKKRRKQVDRRASKGRKLRYHVHAKLVNFVAPRPPAAEPAFATQLFANLFGRRAG